jgi:uncharacterized protein YukE
MAYIPGDGGGSSDLISVDTNALKTTAPTFRQGGQQVNELLQSVKSSVQMANGSMLLILEFAKMASALEHLQERIAEAMQCASGGLQRIGTSLEIVSGLFIETEDSASQTFTHLADDTMPWHINITLPTGVTNGNIGGSSPQVIPTPTPQPPKIVNPQNPIVNPLPGIPGGLIPEIP